MPSRQDARLQIECRTRIPSHDLTAAFGRRQTLRLGSRRTFDKPLDQAASHRDVVRTPHAVLQQRQGGEIAAHPAAGQQIGEVESTKTTSTIYTPVSGTITKINADLKDHPEAVNSDPYGKGWMAVIDLTTPAEVDKLMTAAQYEEFVSKQKH